MLFLYPCTDIGIAFRDLFDKDEQNVIKLIADAHSLLT